MSQIYMPVQTNDLWDILENNPEAEVYAGGTDLLVKHRAHGGAPGCLVCIERLDEFKGIETDGDKILIGALTTHRQIIQDPTIQKAIPILGMSAKTLGSPPVRNMGTIAGNIVTASPAGDTLAPLYVLNAELEIRSRNTTRMIPIESFILGPGKVDLHRGEIVSKVIVSKPRVFRIHHYEKVGRRNALACSVVSMAALMNVTDSDIISEVRLAWGSVGPTIMRFPKLEQLLTGKPLKAKDLSDAVEFVKVSVKPIDDVRASSFYRREVAGRLLLRLLDYSTSK